MPATPTYPGVYIEEVPSPVRSIPGVSTSVTAFVGYTPKGAVNEPGLCFNFGDFERKFGGLHEESEMTYAVQQFFLNGGKEAWIVRVARDARRAGVTLKDEGGNPRLKLEAKSEGGWGNLIRVDVDHRGNPDATFRVTLTEYVRKGIDLLVGRTEVHDRLSMNRWSPRYAPDVLTKQSDLVNAERIGAAGHEAWSQSANIKGAVGAGWADENRRYIGVIFNGRGPYDVPLWMDGATLPTSLWTLRGTLDASLDAFPGVPELATLTVEVILENGAVAANAAESDANGAFLRIRGAHPTDPERASVQIVSASAKDAAAALKLGVANLGRERDGSAGMRPAQTGSVTKDLAYLKDADIPKTQTLVASFIDGTGPAVTGEITLSGAALNSPADIAARFKEKLDALAAGTSPATAKPEFKGARVEVVGTRVRIRPAAGVGTPLARFEFANKAIPPPAPATLLDAVLGLDQPAARNVKEHLLGRGDLAMQTSPVEGKDGIPAQLADHKGSEAKQEGIYALEKVPLFNMLCIPFLGQLDEASHASLLSEAAAYCEKRRAFLVADPPNGLTTPAKAVGWITTAPSSKNAAVYWPEVLVVDPLADNRLRVTPPSGTVAGVYARTDSTRGVWKAPAGTEATFTNVQGLEYVMTDEENGMLNPLALNALRQFPVYGRVSWGARTMVGADAKTSEWKYVPIRRLALYIEESLYRGTQWVVFEPNDEPLWAQIRLNVGAFMHDLFRKGAFQGQSPKEAYFVKCDKSTNPQDEIDRGIVNILVGFAPLKPAEFVIIKISQIAPQAQG